MIYGKRVIVSRNVFFADGSADYIKDEGEWASGEEPRVLRMPWTGQTEFVEVDSAGSDLEGKPRGEEVPVVRRVRHGQTVVEIAPAAASESSGGVNAPGEVPEGCRHDVS